VAAGSPSDTEESTVQIVKIDGEAARSVIAGLVASDPNTVYSLRVAFDDGTVKFKINERVWSPPYGEAE
jgi:hypothetical protein